jgi:hypothetical protein
VSTRGDWEASEYPIDASGEIEAAAAASAAARSNRRFPLVSRIVWRANWSLVSVLVSMEQLAQEL